MSDPAGGGFAGGWFPVADITRFAFSGADRIRYLNGQVTNDVRRLPEGVAMKACVLSAKGRLDGVVWIWAEPDRLIVETDAAVADTLRMRLERYIVADDVELTEAPVRDCVHVVGPAVERLPTGLRTRRIERLGMPGVDLEDNGESLETAGIARLPAETIERLRIENGIPAWGTELDGSTLPAEAGLDRTAVDFHKGCYIGQEVVSRVESVGHANRTLRVFEVVDGAPPAPGAEFFAGEESGKPAALVTSVSFALSPAVGLCYIRRGIPDDQALESPGSASRIQLRPCASPS